MVLIQLNNRTLQRVNDYNAQDKITLTINNIEIVFNKAFAIAISNLIYSQYLLDKNIDKIDISPDVVSDDTYNVLKDFLQYRITEIEVNETVMKDLFQIGLSLEIEELTDLYKTNVIDKMKIDNTNCIKLLEFYMNVSSDEKSIECIDFIAEHFYEIDQNQLKIVPKKFGIDVFKQILSNKKLQITDEDSLAKLIISLAREDIVFSSLVEFIYFEFCSEEIIREMKDFVSSDNYQDVVKFLVDSIIRSRDPKNQDRVFMKEDTNYFESGNVVMSASSTSYGSVELINKYRTDTYFKTHNEPNSWVELKLKQDLLIQPTSYIVRTAPDYGSFVSRLQSWKVEGLTINGETKVIHEVSNSLLNQGEIRKYNITSNDKFASFKLIQTGKNSSNLDNLLIDVFDFSGKVFNKK
ncbi:hypothetical protein TVAG_319870 [Trichomonas vaginalis G3]|uniref:BTB domain-containing protein n=1 Tax=Trichomonas vaginalis (strain ATCC PRA-98 / G3) TaxID=412133 RepID=A2DQD5_TRIV3|nr:protein ubiquitination [Trichomonas vaginalis G3]EAY17392.1 hypothetical protein TVAG_319870 [Trichomonas vaginalis G3]KAI5491403.1 protein ubiquitination [Trichomonas vaginalis G3]|eukprot:XP_001330761.1 hypothetical protein [Trichomonas vaginalis G3]